MFCSQSDTNFAPIPWTITIINQKPITMSLVFYSFEETHLDNQK